MSAAVARAHAAAELLDDLEVQTQDALGAVRVVAGDIEDLGRRVDRARLESRGERRALQRRVEESLAAAAKAAIRRIPEATTTEELGGPLEVVTSAIHASDQLAISALGAGADLAGLERQASAAGIALRQARFRVTSTARQIETTIDELNADLRAAALGRAGAAVADVRRAPAAAETAIGDLHGAGLDLRTAESRLAAISMTLRAWRLSARRAVASSRRTLSELYGDMLLVQDVVSSAMPSFGAVFDGVTPPPVVMSGSGPLFVCPVDEPRSYSDDWGAPRYAGGFHLHQGNDIFAPEGTPIRAPFDGTAVDASNALGGNAVSVYGADGYAYNAHLSRFGALGAVKAGDVIGFVGNTGDADSSPPHDHFEWHPGNGSAVDPYPYLNAVC